MSKARFKLIPAVHLLLIKDGKILLARRFQTGYEDGNYSVIAGLLNGNETVRAAMCREAWEEAAIKIEPTALQLAHVMHRRAEDERIDFFFVAAHWQGEAIITEPDKCDELSWWELSQLPPNTVPYVRAALENFRQGSMYSEFGW